MAKTNKKYKIAELIKIFDLKIVNEAEADLTRTTNSPSIQRTGLELTGGYDISHTAMNIISWGSKENKYFTELKPTKAKEAIRNVLTVKSPLILLSKRITPTIRELIVEVANEFKVPVAATSQHLATLRATIGAELVNRFAAETSVHGSFVVVDGIGVMVIGKSGVGKSEAVLELIQNGHSFVSDDTVVIKQIGKDFVATGAPITKGLLEARGIGLINIPYIYGQRSTKDSAPLELVLELIIQDEAKDLDRLGTKQLEYKVLEGEIPMMQIPVNQGRSVASLIEAATNVFAARKSGMDPLQEMLERRNK